MSDLVKCALTNCGIFFELQRGKKFHSDTCRKEYQRSNKTVTVGCAHCGKQNQYLLRTILAANNKPKPKPKFKGHGNAKTKRESS